MKNNKSKNIEKMVFIISTFISLLIGFTLLYNFDFSKNYGLLFESDTARVIGDITQFASNHYRTSVHPLYVILLQPVYNIIRGLVVDRDIALIFMSSLTTSTTVLFIYKILQKFNNNPKQNIIISLIYLFSFGNIIFTAGAESYNYACLALVLLWYYYISHNNSKNINKYSIFILIFLGILSAAITITNFIIFMIILIMLTMTKYLNIKKSLLVLFTTVLSIIFLNCIQYFTWQNTSLLFNNETVTEKKYISTYDINYKNVLNIIRDNYYNSLISSDIQAKKNYNKSKPEILYYNSVNKYNIIIITILYIIILVLLIRNFNKNILLNIGLITSLLYNTALHSVYGNNAPYLYSLHFLYLIVLLLGINISKEKSKQLKKIINIYLIIFLISQIIINSFYFTRVVKYVQMALKQVIFVKNRGLISTIIMEMLVIIITIILSVYIQMILKNIRKRNSKEKNITLVLLLSFIVLIMHLEFNIMYGYKTSLLKDNIEKKEYNQTKITKKVSYKNFKNKYKNEIDKLEEYNKEYRNFNIKYSNTSNFMINRSKYYYFGFANRRKILYKPGIIMDIKTKEILYKFDEEESVIIPNIYTVLIKTSDNKYIKIYEDESGVHYRENNKDHIIEETDYKIKLYNFNNQKYQNMKKTLYGEILFNIKDSKIYPNIIVYDKPWYRDAAITSMVLRQTNNTNLIEDWVNNIDEIYDKNNGEEEIDNLGEVLYLLSISKKKNEKLITRIEEEAEKNAKSNKKGYYIHGKTDGSDYYLYQNLWYKFGLESVGKKYHFDLDKIEEDYYSKGAWWSDYKTKKINNNDYDNNYPYISYSIRHKQNKGEIITNDSIYPLSWETNAGFAKYDNYKDLDKMVEEIRTSPLHTWAASELLLYVMDITNDLDYDKLK